MSAEQHIILVCPNSGIILLSKLLRMHAVITFINIISNTAN